MGVIAAVAVVTLVEKIAVALSTLAVQQDGSLVAPLIGVRTKILDIKRELEVMRVFLRCAETDRGNNRELVAVWVKQVRDLAFEIEDIVDEYTYLLSGRSRSGLRGRFYNTFYDSKNILAWYEISTQLDKVKSDLQSLSQRKDRFGIKLFAEEESSSRNDHNMSRMLAESAHFIAEDEIVGVEKHKDQLIKWLTDEEPKRTTTTIWGMGGVGKTALATCVYKLPTLRSHFQCDAWISVSQTNATDDLLKRMIKEFDQRKREGIPHDIDSMNYINLVRTLHKYLQHKRYLIILDDIWCANVWNDVSHALVDNGCGSRVVITTRIHDEAFIAPEDRIMRLEPLPVNVAWILFCKHAFRKEEGNCCPRDLEYWGRKIVARCDGLPLAISTIGNLISRKEKTELAWKSIHDGFVWEQDDLPELQKVSTILNFSINDLPYYLRNCFLYCSIFPEDYENERKRLIKLWVAEGFVEKQGEKSLEEVAEDYFNQLIGRCMLQPTQCNFFQRVHRCRIHDLVRELIVKKSRDENVSQVPSNSYPENNFSTRVRHVSITNCGTDLQLSMKMPQLRSLHVFSSNFSNPLSLPNFRLLRVLNLRGAPLKRLPHGVVHLFNLRYLCIRGSMIRQLPKAMGRLRNLETLDACESCLTGLPRGITKIEKLRHLMVSGSHSKTSKYVRYIHPVNIPRGIWNLKALQTLKFVHVDEETARRLGNLTEIRTLSVRVRGIHSIELSASIVKLIHLVTLRITAYSAEDALQLETLTSPPPHLLKLQLNGKLDNGVLPSWIGSLTNLKYLGLIQSRLGQDSIFTLSLLCNLAAVILDDAYEGEKLCFRTGWLPKLKALQLRHLRHLRYIEVQTGALASLIELCLIRCVELKALPEGIENLIHLQRLELEELSDEFTRKLLKGERSSDDSHRIQHIPIIRNCVRREDGGWDEEMFA